MKNSRELLALFQNCVTSGMLDFQRAVNLAYWIQQVHDVSGDIAEFGCHKGHTSVLLAAMTDRKVWLFDSFKGLPARSSHDIALEHFDEGSMRTTRETVLETFKAAGVSAPVIVEKWFKDLKVTDLPAKIAYAYCDGDFYHSISESLDIVYPRLSRGAVCIIDDYSWHGLPGVKLAVDQFMAVRPEKLVHPTTLGYKAHQAWFVKL